MVFHCRIHLSREINFKSSHLRYASKTYSQYQVVVKLLGSFRLAAGNRHLHRYCIFTELFPETVAQSLHYSCASELHVHRSTCTHTNIRIDTNLRMATNPLCFRKGIDYIFTQFGIKVRPFSRSKVKPWELGPASYGFLHSRTVLAILVTTSLR